MESNTPAYKTRLALLLTSAWVLGLGGISFYTPAMTSVQKSFHISEVSIKLSISYFILGKAIGMLFAIPFADRFPRKILLLLGIGLFTIGSLVCLISMKIDLFLFGRLLEGLGVSLCILMGRAYINDQYTANHATNLFSIIFIGNAIAITLLPIAAGYVTTFLNWRFIFLILSIYGMLIALLIYCWLPKGVYRGTDHLSFKSLLKNTYCILTHPAFIGFMLALSFVDAGEKVITTLAPFIFIIIYHFNSITFGYLQSVFWCMHLLGLICCGVWVLKTGIDHMIGIGAILCLSAIPSMLIALFVPHLTLIFLLLGLLTYMISTGFILTTSLVGVARPFPDMVGRATALAMTIEFFLGFLLTNLVSHIKGQSVQELTWILIPISVIIFSCWYFLIAKVKN